MHRFLKYLSLTALLATILHAGGFALSGVGVRAQSMGGAFRAVADDWSTLFWNPAGLAYITESQLAINGLGVRPFNSYEPNTGILGYDGPYTLREKVNAHPQNFYIPAFAYITPFEIAEAELAYLSLCLLALAQNGTFTTFRLATTIPLILRLKPQNMKNTTGKATYLYTMYSSPMQNPLVTSA
ncbi:MAG: hypothetical protein QMD82_03410 [bacterium]|nr:hypothetical protein [bacterium]